MERGNQNGLMAVSFVYTDGIKNDSESLLGRNAKDLKNGQEGPMEGKNLRQGHENLKPMHRASINESLFISSMFVANIVMSRRWVVWMVALQFHLIGWFVFLVQ